MSSPRVLSWVRVDFDRARATNRDGIAHYLSLAKDIHDQTLAIQAETTQLEGDVASHPIMSVDEAHQKAWDMFNGAGAGAGEKALEFAHAYWQSLKHPWHDQVLAAHSKAMAVVVKRTAEEQQRLIDLERTIDATFHITVTENRASFQADLAKPEFTWAEKVRQIAAAVLEVTEPSQVEQVREVVASVAASDPRHQHLTLEALTVALANEARAQEQARALALYRARQHQALVERMERLLQQCETRVASLETTHATRLEDELKQLRVKLSTPTVQDADEEALQSLSQKIDAEVRAESVLEAAVAELNRLGYVAVDVMATVGPAEITSVYLEDPTDPERLVLLQTSDKAHLLSGEVQRREPGGPASRERQADHAAQTRLCSALEKIEEALKSRWDLQVHSSTPPGVELRVNSKVRRTRKRLRTASATRSRSLGV